MLRLTRPLTASRVLPFVVISPLLLMLTVRSFESAHLISHHPSTTQKHNNNRVMAATTSLQATAEKQQQQVVGDDIPTVFGEIIRGELPASILTESSTLLAFRDRTPRAPLHALIIPKLKAIPSVFDLNESSNDDVELLEEMQEMARSLVGDHYPEALEVEDFQLCFHVPPFNSVDHLHLHVLAPASDMTTWPQLKYKVGSRWCISYEMVYERLKLGHAAVPFGKWDFLPPVIGTCLVLVAVPTILASVLNSH